MEESLEFHKNCKLRVQELSNFGENNLSPLAAALLAGKSQQDLNKLIENGAEPNAKNQFGQTAAEMAMMEKGEVKKQQSNSQDDDEERSQRPKAVKRKFTAVKQSSLQEDSSKEDQQREEMQQRQLAEAAVALEMHEVEMMKLLRVAIRKKEALEEVQEQKTATETVEKSSTETHLEKEKQSAENALAKALGLGLGEKIDINKMLFEAVQNGRPMFALLLIRFGADVNHKENGVTILGAAIAGGNNSLISILSDFSNPENRKAALDANRVNEAVLKLVGGAGEVERAVKDVPQLKRDAKMIEEIKDNLRENQKESRQRNLESDVPAITKVKNNISLNPRPPSPSPEPLEAKLVKAKIFSREFLYLN
jgi:ankyrin repeat protein